MQYYFPEQLYCFTFPAAEVHILTKFVIFFFDSSYPNGCDVIKSFNKLLRWRHLFPFRVLYRVIIFLMFFPLKTIMNLFFHVSGYFLRNKWVKRYIILKVFVKFCQNVLKKGFASWHWIRVLKHLSFDPSLSCDWATEKCYHIVF